MNERDGEKLDVQEVETGLSRFLELWQEQLFIVEESAIEGDHQSLVAAVNSLGATRQQMIDGIGSLLAMLDKAIEQRDALASRLDSAEESAYQEGFAEGVEWAHSGDYLEDHGFENMIEAGIDPADAELIARLSARGVISRDLLNALMDAKSALELRLHLGDD